MTEHSIPVAAALTGWRKSSYSADDPGSCVEVLDNHPSGIPVRDSKTPHAPALLISPPSWTSFITAVKDGAALGIDG